MNKTISLLFAVLLVLPFVSAIPPVQTTITTDMEIAYPKYQILKINEPFMTHIHVVNSSNVLTNATISCDFHLYNGQGNSIYETKLIWDGSEWELSIPASNFSTLGNHGYLILCNSSSQSAFVSGAFDVTPTGYGNDLTRGLIYVVALSILGIMAFLLLSNMITSNSYGWRIGFFCIFWLISVVMSFLSWTLANNYLYDAPFLAEILNVVWITFVALTPIIFLVSIFKILQYQAEEGLINSKEKYGYSREEAESKYRKK